MLSAPSTPDDLRYHVHVTSENSPHTTMQINTDESIGQFIAGLGIHNADLQGTSFTICQTHRVKCLIRRTGDTDIEFEDNEVCPRDPIQKIIDAVSSSFPEYTINSILHNNCAISPQTLISALPLAEPFLDITCTPLSVKMTVHIVREKKKRDDLTLSLPNNASISDLRNAIDTEFGCNCYEILIKNASDAEIPNDTKILTLTPTGITPTVYLTLKNTTYTFNITLINGTDNIPLGNNSSVIPNNCQAHLMEKTIKEYLKEYYPRYQAQSILCNNEPLVPKNLVAQYSPETGNLTLEVSVTAPCQPALPEAPHPGIKLPEIRDPEQQLPKMIQITVKVSFYGADPKLVVGRAFDFTEISSAFSPQDTVEKIIEEIKKQKGEDYIVEMFSNQRKVGPNTKISGLDLKNLSANAYFS